MEISSLQQHQAMATHLESSNVLHLPQRDQKKPRPQPEQSPKCPRCDSTNTKFCYYNNYSLSQPRYFCKACRRYWTKGGSLRNVPVGGGCRKNHKRTPNPNSSSKPNNKQDQELPIPALPPLTFDPNELSFDMLANPNPNPNPDVAGFLDILRNGINASGQFHEYCGGSAGTSTGLMMFPNFDGGLISTETAATVVTTASNALDDNVGCEDNMWDHHHYHHGNMGVEWSGMQQGASSWHGIINGSLM